MGLGKTAQAAVFLRLLRDDCGCDDPALVIAPLSTLEHWRRELGRWSSLDVVVLQGSPAERALIFEHELDGGAAASLQVLLTTPETLLARGVLKKLRRLRWAALVVDEV